MYTAKLTDPVSGHSLEFVMSDIIQDAMLPVAGQVSKPLYLSRIASYEVGHHSYRQDLGASIVKAVGFFMPGASAAERASVSWIETHFVDREYGRLVFFGSRKEYIFEASPGVFKHIQKIMDERYCHGRYKEKLPGPISSVFTRVVGFFSLLFQTWFIWLPVLLLIGYLLSLLNDYFGRIFPIDLFGLLYAVLFFYLLIKVILFTASEKKFEEEKRHYFILHKIDSPKITDIFGQMFDEKGNQLVGKDLKYASVPYYFDDEPLPEGAVVFSVNENGQITKPKQSVPNLTKASPALPKSSVETAQQTKNEPVKTADKAQATKPKPVIPKKPVQAKMDMNEEIPISQLKRKSKQ